MPFHDRFFLDDPRGVRFGSVEAGSVSLSEEDDWLELAPEPSLFAEEDWRKEPGPRSQRRWVHKSGRVAYSDTNPGASKRKGKETGGKVKEAKPAKLTVDGAHAHIQGLIAKPPADMGVAVQELAQHLMGLTVTQLGELKGKLGLKASGAKLEYATKIAERALAGAKAKKPPAKKVAPKRPARPYPPAPPPGALAGAPYTAFDTDTNNQGKIGKVEVGGRPYFCKSLAADGSSVKRETLTAQLAHLAGVPAPAAWQVPVPQAPSGADAILLTEWVEGDVFSKAMDVDVDESQPSELLKTLGPEGQKDIQRHLLFGFVTGQGDRHLGNFMVSRMSGRVYSIDHEYGLFEDVALVQGWGSALQNVGLGNTSTADIAKAFVSGNLFEPVTYGFADPKMPLGELMSWSGPDFEREAHFDRDVLRSMVDAVPQMAETVRPEFPRAAERILHHGNVLRKMLASGDLSLANMRKIAGEAMP